MGTPETWESARGEALEGNLVLAERVTFLSFSLMVGGGIGAIVAVLLGWW